MQNGQLHRLLKEKGISSSIVESIPLDRIASIHFRDGKTKKSKNSANEFSLVKARIENFYLEKEKDPSELFNWFCHNRANDVREIIKRLSMNSVLGHYFFEKIDPASPNLDGFVCLLREVCTLPKSVARRLGHGIAEEEYSSHRQSGNLSLFFCA